MVLSLIACALSVSLNYAQDEKMPPPYLPGILQADPVPDGCVDCHIDRGSDGDFRLNKALERIPHHPDVTKAFKNAPIPATCFLCHKEGSKLGSLGPNLHRVHYEKLGGSQFVASYAGSCLNCHSLAADSGEMGFKTGIANW